MRVTTNDGYLEPARGRPNLDIRGEALVERVLFDGKRATGVQVSFAGGPAETLHADTVVLCAGSIHSPAILMRSGIGPAAALAALGIPILHDAPAVGRNLMDHPILRATLHLKPPYQAQDMEARHTNCCVTYSSRLAGGGDRDMILIGYNHRALPAPGDTRPGGTGAIGAALYNAFSRGELHLASADPRANPVVEENMLADERDRLRMRDAIRRLAELAAQPAIAGICESIRLGDTPLTPAEAAALPADELDAVMLAEAADIQHAAGTCHMTAYEDQRGVVDPDLCVRGVSGLRVADASIMPTDWPRQFALHLRDDRRKPCPSHAERRISPDVAPFHRRTKAWNRRDLRRRHRADHRGRPSPSGSASSISCRWRWAACRVIPERRQTSRSVLLTKVPPR